MPIEVQSLDPQNVQSTHNKRTLTNIIVHGTSMLDTNDNASLFKHIQTYITNSKRFWLYTHVLFVYLILLS